MGCLSERPPPGLNEVLLERASAGEIPCPWCSQALTAQQLELEEEPVILLTCPGPFCSFEEQ